MLERADAIEAQIAQLLDGLRASADAMTADIRGGADQLGRELADIRRGLGEARTARPEPTETLHEEPPPPAAPEPATRAGAGVCGAGARYSEPEPAAGARARVQRARAGICRAARAGHLAPQPEDESLKIQGDELQDRGTRSAGARARAVPARGRAGAEPEPAAGGGGGAGSEGARLIALNMALNGTPRAETAAYLADNFDLPDQDALLDEVYSRAGS